MDITISSPFKGVSLIVFCLTLVLSVKPSLQANGSGTTKTNDEIVWWQIIIIAVLCFLVVIVVIIIFMLILKLRGRNNKIDDTESAYDRRLSEEMKSKIPEEQPKTPERTKTPFEIKASTANIKYSQPARDSITSALNGRKSAMPEVETNDLELSSDVVSPSDTYFEEKKEKKKKPKKKKKKKKIKVERSDSNLDEARKIYGFGR